MNKSFGRNSPVIEERFVALRRIRLVQHDSIERAELADPCGLDERAAGVSISRLPAFADSRRAEVDRLAARET